MKRNKIHSITDVFHLRERVEKLYEGAQGRQSTGDQPAWVPAVDICETFSEYVMQAELPEVAEEDISVRTEGSILRISGRRNFRTEGRNYHRVERRFGFFSRSFPLPEDVDPDGIHASLCDGILTVRIPKVNPGDMHRFRVP